MHLTLFSILTAASVLGVVSTAAANPEQIVESTYKLFNKTSTATCFLVHRPGEEDRPILVTAAHVFEKMQGETAMLVLRKKNADGKHVRHDHELRVREKKKALWTKHEEHDIAVLQLPGRPEGAPCPSLPIAALASWAHAAAAGAGVGDRVFVLTYPERFEANDAGFPVVRGATIASHPFGPPHHHPSFLADFTAFGGDSGGPVLSSRAGDEAATIIGLVVAQFRHDEKLTMLNEERQVHHPLGLGKVMHAEFVTDLIAKLPE